MKRDNPPLSELIGEIAAVKQKEPFEIVGMHDLLEALEATIASAPEAKRKELSRVIDAYADDFPDDYWWALSAQAPTLLYHLMISITPNKMKGH